MEDRAIFACNKLLMTPLTEGEVLVGIKSVHESEEFRQKKMALQTQPKKSLQASPKVYLTLQQYALAAGPFHKKKT